MILDCSYNYHANNMYDQQVAPMEIYVTNKHPKTTTLSAVNNQPCIHLFLKKNHLAL